MSAFTPKEIEGYEAFHAGQNISANHYALSDGRDEWNKGWLYAREEHRIGYTLGQSLRRALAPESEE